MKKFLIIKKSDNYYSISYYEDAEVNCQHEIEITSATSKSKAKRKLKLIRKAYKIGYSDGFS